MGAKRALLVGCSYPGTSAELRGCGNDVDAIKALLIGTFGFLESDMRILRDDIGADPSRLPTRANISASLPWLLAGAQPGDSLFFHFSGHGSQCADLDGDEDDGKDETLCPCDYETSGMISDDELNAALVRPLPAGVTLHAVVDACHSGTALDLNYRTKNDFLHTKFSWKGADRPERGTAGGVVFQFGACKDKQTAMDTNALAGGVFTGAATFAFVDTIGKLGADVTYAALLEAQYAAMKVASGAGGHNSLSRIGGALKGVASALKAGRVEDAARAIKDVAGDVVSGIRGGPQSPVISCSEKVDLYHTRLRI